MNRYEISQSASGLEIASSAAVSSLGLEPGKFYRFNAHVPPRLTPQTTISEGEILFDVYNDLVTFFGGAREGFEYGKIESLIHEPIETTRLVDSLEEDPFIPRGLTLSNNLITVSISSHEPDSLQAPLVTMVRRDGKKRFNETTIYNIDTGEILIKKGTIDYADPNNPVDETTQQDIDELDPTIAATRMINAVSTIQRTATIFEQVAWKDPSVNLEIKHS